MFDYTFVAAPVRMTAQGSDAGYRDEVARHAAAGWRLVQVLVENPAAVPDRYTLIFERPQQIGDSTTPQ